MDATTLHERSAAATPSSKGAEDCDDGNQVQTDGCLNNCRAASCGDGIIKLA